MTLLTGDDYLRSITARQSRISALAALDRSRLQPDPVQNFSFGEQLGAAFRTENLFVTHAAPLFLEEQAFAAEPGFDPAPFLGGYEQFLPQYPELAEASSLGELASIKNQIDSELEDRRKLEGMGLGRALLVNLPAGMLSPENFIPIGAGLRAAGLVGKTALRSVAATALRVGVEGVVTQTLAELALQQKQRFRTDEESLYNVIGTGLFATVLGGAGGALGTGKRAALRATVAGREVTTDVVEETAAAVAKELSDPNSKLGAAYRQAVDDQKTLVRFGGSNVLPSSVLPNVREDPVFGSSLIPDQLNDPTQGALLEVLASKNPDLAKLVGADTLIGHILTKAMILNPGMRLGSSDNAVSRTLNDTLLKSFLTEDGAKGTSVESNIQSAEAVLQRRAREARGIWEGSKKLFKEEGIKEPEYRELAGKAARRGFVDTADPEFARIADKPELIDIVEKRMAAHREFNELLHRSMDDAGALSRSGITPTRGLSLLDSLSPEYVSRVVKKDEAFSNLPEFLVDIEEALKARIPEVLPGLKDELKTLQTLAKNSDNPRHVEFLKGQIEEYKSLIDLVDKKDGFRNVSISVADNYLGNSSASQGTSTVQSALRARVFKIDERYIERWLESDVDMLEARAIRSLAPDLQISSHFAKQGSDQPRSALLKERLDQFTKTVNNVAETDRASPELAAKIVQDAQDLSDGAQALVLGETLRLVKDLEAVGVSDLGRTLKDIDRRVGTRIDSRRKLDVLDAERARLKEELKDVEVDPPALLPRSQGEVPLPGAGTASKEEVLGALDPVLEAVRGEHAGPLDASARLFRQLDKLLEDPDANKGRLLLVLEDIHNDLVGGVHGDLQDFGRLNPDFEAALRDVVPKVQEAVRVLRLGLSEDDVAKIRVREDLRFFRDAERNKKATKKAGSRQKRIIELEKELAELEARQPKLASPSETQKAKTPKTTDALESIKKKLATLAETRKAERARFDGATKPMNKMARKVEDQLKNNKTSMAREAGSLRFGDNMFKLAGAETYDEAKAQLLATARTTHAKVSGARSYAFRLNLSTEHLENAIRRESARNLPPESKPGKRKKHVAREDRDVKDMITEVGRLRNASTTGGPGTFDLALRRARDYAFTTKMGSVLLSSQPDALMGTSVATFREHGAAIARVVKSNFEGTDKTFAQEHAMSLERALLTKRHAKLHSLDDDISTAASGRAGRAFDATVGVFGKLTGMEPWNSFWKQVSAVEVESALARVILSKKPNSKDLALFRWFGAGDEEFTMFRKQLETSMTRDGVLRLSNVEEWSDRRAAMEWGAVINNAIAKVIITLGAGDAPGISDHQLVKNILQFRNFAFAATNKFVIPGLQRTALGDPRPAITFAMLSTMGIYVTGLNELLKGRDPTEMSALQLIGNGIDRGGGLGILTEGFASVDKLFGSGNSRFRSRNVADSLVGPTFGTLQDVTQALSAAVQPEFTPGDASRLRRLVPFQNLWLLRILADGGLNLASNGTKDYFDDFLKIEHRALGFEPGEVN